MSDPRPAPQDGRRDRGRRDCGRRDCGRDCGRATLRPPRPPRRPVLAALLATVIGAGLLATAPVATARPRTLPTSAGAIDARPSPGGGPSAGASPSAGGGPRVDASAPAGAGVPVGAAPDGDGTGLWIADTNGSVAADGTASPIPGQRTTAQPTVGIAGDPTGRGYWLLGASGHVTAVGGAPDLASVAGARLTEPVIGIVAAPGGQGYWIYSRGGRIFTAGRARLYGSIPRHAPASPVASMAAMPNGRGYWLVERNGRIFAFGAARAHGSPWRKRLASPIVDMVVTPDGLGYWLLTRSGRVYAYGTAREHGGIVTHDAPVVGLVASRGGTGYWIVCDNGRVRHFGTAGPVRWVKSAGRSLVGAIITLDPGHNGGNINDLAYIDHLVPSGPGMQKACDTTGTETDQGYTEAAFNFDVVARLAAVLRADGARVVLTRDTNSGVGPCINQRAAIGNGARSDVALSVHADGGPAGGRGFSVLLPALFDGYNNAVVPPSDRLGTVLRDTMATSGVLPVSDYYGTDGLQVRGDLGGLNLSVVPKVLIEVGNMRNATDASLQVRAAWRQRIAEVLAVGLASFLLTSP